MKKFTIAALRKLEPCRDGLVFAESQPSPAAAWDNCKRPDWMFWILERVAPLTKQQSVRLAIAFAKQALPQFVACYPNDDRPAKAIAAAEVWISDPTEVNQSAADSAARAAWSAARAASAARAVWSAAWSAANSAAWSAASAADSAASAADSAASAADSAASAARAVWSAAWSAANSAAWSAQSDIIRSIVKNPFKKGK